MALYQFENLETGLTSYVEVAAGQEPLGALALDKGYPSLQAANQDGECLDGLYFTFDVTGMV